MTRLPAEQVRIGAGRDDLPIYPASERCANPYCPNRSKDKHHITRRSFIGDYWWVEIDGEPRPNICWLCRPCHQQITDNERRIRWNGNLYEWIEDEETPEYAPLEPYPGPPVEGVAVGDAAVSSAARSLVGELERATPSTDGPRRLHSHGGLVPGSTCPKCRRRINYPRKESSPNSNLFQFRIPQDDLASFTKLVEDAGTDLKDLRYWRFRLFEAALTIALQDPDWRFVRGMFSDDEPLGGEAVLAANSADTTDQGGNGAT